MRGAGPPSFSRRPDCGSYRSFDGAARNDAPVLANGGRYELATGGNSQPNSETAITASVRLVTANALRIAVTWFFTVGSARLRTRQIALLLLPCIMRASTSS